MLRVNIFFMLFEKLLYVTKELLLLMLLIFLLVCFSIQQRQIAVPFSLPHHSFHPQISLSSAALQKLIYSMDQLTKFYGNMLRHDNWTSLQMEMISCNVGDSSSCFSLSFRHAHFFEKANQHLSSWFNRKKFLIIDFSLLFHALAALFWRLIFTFMVATARNIVCRQFRFH